MRASDPAFLVLHALRLKGFADVGAIASLAGIEASDAEQRLQEAAARELVTHRAGRISGWSLTPSGRQHHRDLVAREMEDAPTREAVERGYQRFLSVNTELLEVCTAWQVRNGSLNDHSDLAYDRDVIRRLCAVDDAVQPVCADLGRALQRFSSYGARLTAARTKVEGGDGTWFTKPMIDSYHTVWFELHEDLLATLGIERSKEAGA